MTKEQEKLLRTLAEQKYESVKGSLGRVVGEGIEQLALNEKMLAAREKAIESMKKGLNLGIKQFRREDAYD